MPVAATQIRTIIPVDRSGGGSAVVMTADSLLRVAERKRANNSATVTSVRTATETQSMNHQSAAMCAACGPAGLSADRIILYESSGFYSNAANGIGGKKFSFRLSR